MRGKVSLTESRLSIYRMMSKHLYAGNDVEYEGAVLKAGDFRSDTIPGLSIIISGDTAEQAIDSNCDLLIHEATFLQSHADIANEHLHSTAAGAARTC